MYLEYVEEPLDRKGTDDDEDVDQSGQKYCQQEEIWLRKYF